MRVQQLGDLAAKLRHIIDLVMDVILHSTPGAPMKVDEVFVEVAGKQRFQGIP